MRYLICITILLFSISFYLPAQAQPPLWQNDFGDELTDLSSCDDCAQSIVFPFPILFNGTIYNMADVSTNGCIHLNGLGLAGTTDYRYWSNMEDFLSDSDPDNPNICPFDTDLNTEDLGTIYYNNSGNPLIITWDGVGSNQNTAIPSTFQILLFQNGRIVFNYNGIMVGGNIIEDLANGIVSGVTPSDFPYNSEDFVPGDPGPVDLNQGPFTFGSTVYERWCYDQANSCGVGGTDTGLPGPVNTAFDLDFWSICYSPNADGFSITSAFEGAAFDDCGIVPAQVPTLSEWGLITMATILGSIGFFVLRRRKVSA